MANPIKVSLKIMAEAAGVKPATDQAGASLKKLKGDAEAAGRAVAAVEDAANDAASGLNELKTAGDAAGDAVEDAGAAGGKAGAGLKKLADDGKKAGAALDDAGGKAKKGARAARSAAEEIAGAGAKMARSTQLSAQQSLQLSYQLNDIFTQLASGQSIFVTMAQQGPQITQIFGGLGNTLKLIPAPALAAVAAVTAIGIAANLVLGRVSGMNAELRRFGAELKTINPAAGVTAERLRQIGFSVSQAKGANRQDVNSALSAIVGSRGVQGADMIEGVAGVAVELDALKGGGIEQWAEKIGQAFAKGAAGVRELDGQLNFLSAAQAKSIRDFEQQGNRAAALGVALDALKGKYAGTAQSIKSEWDKAVDAMGTAWDAFVERLANSDMAGTIAKLAASAARGWAEILRPDSIAEQIVAANRALVAAEKTVQGYEFLADGGQQEFAALVPGAKAEVERLQAQLDGLIAQARAEADKLKPPAAANSNSPAGPVANDNAAQLTEAEKKRIDDLTEALGRERQAMAGSAAERQVRLARLQAEQAALDSGKRLVEAQAIGLIAEQRARLEATTAIADQTAQARVSTSGTLAMAAATLKAGGSLQAYVSASADALRQDAARQAGIEAKTRAIDVEARAQEILGQKMADQVAAGAQAVADAELEVTARQKAAEAALGGAAAQQKLKLEQDIQRATLPYVIAQTLAEGDAKKQLASIVERLTKALREQASADQEAALVGPLRDQANNIRLAERQLELIGQRVEIRDRELATLRATIELEARGDGSADTDEGRQYIENAQRIAELNSVIQRHQGVYDELSNLAGQAWDRIGSAITETVLKGQDGAVKLSNVWKAALSEMTQAVLKMGLLNPGRNLLFGSSLPTLADMGSRGGRSSSGISLPGISIGSPANDDSAGGGGVDATGIMGAVSAAGQRIGDFFSRRPGVGTRVSSPNGRGLGRTVNQPNSSAGFWGSSSIGGAAMAGLGGAVAGYSSGSPLMGGAMGGLMAAGAGLGPWGMAAGAAIGAIAGVVGGAAKRRAKEDAANVKKAQDLNNLSINIQSFIDAATATSEAGRQMKELTTKFGQLSGEARRLGRDTRDLELAFDQARKKITTDFNNKIADELADALDDPAMQLQSLQRKQEQRIREAIDAEGDLAQVRRLNAAELANFQRELNSEQLAALGDLADAAQVLRAAIDDLLGSVNDQIGEQIELARTAAQTARESERAYRQAATSIFSAIDEIRKGGLSNQNAFTAAQGRFNDLLTAAGGGSLEAMTALPQAAKDYLEAAKAFTGGTAFQQIKGGILDGLAQAGLDANTLANAADYQATLLETQVDLLEAIRDNLAQETPDQALLTQQLQVLGGISSLLEGTQDVSILSDSSPEGQQLRRLVNEQTGQVVRVGNLSDEQLQQIIAGAGDIRDLNQLTTTGNTLTETVGGRILTGNTTQDIIRASGLRQEQLHEQVLQTITGTASTQQQTLGAIIRGNADLLAALQAYTAMDAKQRDAVARQQIEAGVETARLARIDTAATTARRAALTSASAVSFIRSQEPTKNNEQLDQRFSLATGAITSEASDRGETQRDRIEPLRNAMVNLGQQLATLTGGTLPSDAGLSVSSKYGITYTLGGRTAKYGINDYNSALSGFLRDLAQQMTGVDPALQEVLSQQIWTDIPTAIEAIARKKAELADPKRVWGGVNAPSANVLANIALSDATGYKGNFDGAGGFDTWIRSQPESVKAAARSVLIAHNQASRITFATGGAVIGPGTGTSDSIPAWLSNGEHVIRATTVARYGHDVMALVNAGDLGAAWMLAQSKGKAPGFADGGPVGGLDIRIPELPRQAPANDQSTETVKVLRDIRDELRKLNDETADAADDAVKDGRQLRNTLLKLVDLTERMEARSARQVGATG